MMRFILLLLVIISSYQNTYSNTPPYEFRDVGVDNKINAVLLEDIILTDEFDKTINLKDLINNKPTIINFVYLNCPLLCHLLLDGLADVGKRSTHKIPDDYQIISISIDPRETNENLKAYKKKYLNQLASQSGWSFLKGAEDQIKAITSTLGFNYKYIKRTNDYSHPSVIYFYNGKLINYLEGVTFDLKSFNYSIINSKPTQTLREKVITYCYYFDPDKQTYTFTIFKILRVLCLITVVILSIIIIQLLRKERRLNKNG